MMPYSGHIPEQEAAPNEASHAHMPEYLLVFRDDKPPPKEHSFSAISDDAAADLMCKQYPRYAWSLYHVDDRGTRGECFYSHHAKQWPGEASSKT
jgi:hypothetical protein